MSWTNTNYSFNETTSFGAPGPNYQIVSALPAATNALVGTLFYLKGPPDALYVLRVNAQGSLVYQKLGGRAIRLKLCSADFTPFGVGQDNGGLGIIPYDPDETTPLTPITWTVVDIMFRIETVSSSGATSLQIAHSIGTGTFVNTGYLNTVPVTIPINANEPTVRPATISVTTVTSGDKIAPYYSAIGIGASGFTAYLILRESN